MALEKESLSGREHLIIAKNICITAAFGLLFISGPALADRQSESGGQLRFIRETISLPGDEKMGWIGGGLIFGVNDYLSLGMESFGAVTGQRGGFITLGGSALAKRPLSQHWLAEAGVHLGAGGGRGGYTLSGGGLLVRSHVGLDYRLIPGTSLGFGISDVRFPNGVISSRQAYLQLQHDFSMLRPGGWSGESAPFPSSGPQSVPVKEHQLAAVVRHYRIPAGVETDAGTPQHPTMQLVGVEWERKLGQNGFLKLESEGAAGGKSTGYMQILVGGGYRQPLFGPISLRLSASAGPAGGGGVDTGGGMIGDAGLGVDWRLGRKAAVGVSMSEVRSFTQSFEARSTSLTVAYTFDLPDLLTIDSAYDWTGFTAERLRIRSKVQQYRQAADNWRSHHAEQTVENLGFALDYFPSEHLYFTGQGLAAFRGDAGAYMTGLLGGGIHMPWGPLYVEVEGLIGAAGGGGLAMGGGSVIQGMAALGWHLGPSSSVALSLGRLHALTGDFRANVIGLTLAHRFSPVLR